MRVASKRTARLRRRIQAIQNVAKAEICAESPKGLSWATDTSVDIQGEVMSEPSQLNLLDLKKVLLEYQIYMTDKLLDAFRIDMLMGAGLFMIAVSHAIHLWGHP